MELKDPRKIAEEWNSSTQKITEGINKNLKKLAESKNLKEFIENIETDITEIQDLTKKMYESNIDDVRLKVLEKTEDLQDKLQTFHDYVEKSNNGSTTNEEIITDESDEMTETVFENETEEIIEETAEMPKESNNENKITLE